MAKLSLINTVFLWGMLLQQLGTSYRFDIYHLPKNLNNSISHGVAFLSIICLVLMLTKYYKAFYTYFAINAAMILYFVFFETNHIKIYDLVWPIFNLIVGAALFLPELIKSKLEAAIK